MSLMSLGNLRKNLPKLSKFPKFPNIIYEILHRHILFVIMLLHEVGVWPRGGVRHFGIGRGAVYLQRGQLPVWQRHAIVLRPHDKEGAERGLLPCQCHEARRRMPIDDYPQRHRLGGGEQLARGLRYRHKHIQRGGSHNKPYVATLHTLHLRREGLHHADMG